MKEEEYDRIFKNEKIHWWYLGMEKISLSILESNLPQNKNLTILDAGCGTGGMILALKKFGTVFGIDKSAKAIELCRQRKIENLKTASLDHLPFNDNTFDLVTCFDVLYHQWIHDDLKVLEEFRRVLRPNGLLLIRVPAYNWLRGHHDLIVLTERRYTKKLMTDKIKKTNFEIIKSTYANTLLFPIALLKRMSERFLSKKEESDVSLPNRLVNNFFLKILLLEKVLLNFFDLPFGLSVFVLAKKIKR